MTVRFCADPEAEVERVELDGLSLIFHRLSGATHIVASPAPEILEMLRQGPADAEELLIRLQSLYAVEDGQLASMDARLLELEAAGLVHRT